MLMLISHRSDPGCGSPSSSAGLQGRLPNISAQAAGRMTWQGAGEGQGEGTALGSEACGGTDALVAVWVGVRRHTHFGQV